ncbi:hypothetical protein [Massilioclostridium coli]|uniref:hypothetical protein n=1 Tax=Massilioclostridium coli TaxID=1870991 RepID=UPI001A9AD8E3|nr:hypothetical protein [Massilioclostridium coli]
MACCSSTSPCAAAVTPVAEKTIAELISAARTRLNIFLFFIKIPPFFAIFRHIIEYYYYTIGKISRQSKIVLFQFIGKKIGCYPAILVKSM